MNAFAPDDVARLFGLYAAVFADRKQELIELDSMVGDSDLGLTMSKGFGAANDAVAALDGPTVESQLKIAGAALAKAAPSTMGTLMATGFLRGSAAAKDRDDLDVAGLAAFWEAFRDGVAQRGKAELGDKTVLDVLHPIAGEMRARADAGAGLADALGHARDQAEAALARTRDMVAQRGKAAAFQDRTRGVQDAGGTVAVILIDTMAALAEG